MAYTVHNPMGNKHYLADDVDDLKKITQVSMGDTCRVIANGKIYCVDSTKTWVEIGSKTNGTSTGVNQAVWSPV